MKINQLIALISALFLINCGGPAMDEMYVGDIEIEGKSYGVYLLGSDSTETTGYFNYKRMELRTGQTDEPFITVDSLDYYAFTDEGEPAFASLDYTFDGFQDIQIQSESFMYQYLPHDLWIYQPETRTFKYSDFLSMAPDAYFSEEEKLIILNQFDHASTTTTSYYSYQKGEFKLVKEKEEVQEFSGIWTSTISEDVNGAWVEIEKKRTLGGVELKKSGEITDAEDMKSFIGAIVDDMQDFDPVIYEDGTYLDYHDSCYETGFFLYGYSPEGASENVLEYLPFIEWEMMYEGPVEYGAIVKITYSAGGESFKLHYRLMYEDPGEFFIGEEIERYMSFSYSKDFGWIAKCDVCGDDYYYLEANQVANLPNSEEACPEMDY